MKKKIEQASVLFLFLWLMENKQIARNFRLLAQLMEIHEENPFKIKSYTNAAFKIDKAPVAIASISPDDLENVEGIGKSTAQKISELLETGKIKEIENLLEITPTGIVDMLRIKGLGPKKIGIIWKELGIESTGELYYACNENRLIEAKGFGLKTQEEIKKILEFSMGNQGKFLYATVEKFAQNLLEQLTNHPSIEKVALTGQFRRRCEIIDQLDFLVVSDTIENLLDTDEFLLISVDKALAKYTSADGLILHLHKTTKENFYTDLFITTGHNVFIESFNKTHDFSKDTFSSEEDIFEQVNLQYIAPELRENENVIEKAKNHAIKDLIELADLKGSLHNHSTYSDGVHSLKDMALYCKQLGYEYFGICDHSKSAFYANGLNEQRVAQQHAEIDKLNLELAPFRIFKGIESDILFDGSLDYGTEVLASFDFVVASVHSQLKMNEEKANERIIKAIENPYTTILGHPTGRLLLARQGYPIDHKKILDACAANGVVIELNANPLRLDLDWRWIDYALSKNVMISINPDAHRKEGFYDMHFGVLAARKGGLYKEMCFNALNCEEISTWFNQKKSHVG